MTNNNDRENAKQKSSSTDGVKPYRATLATRYEIIDGILSRQVGWISAADSKVAPVFAIDTAMLSVIAAIIPPSKSWTVIMVVVTCLAAIALLGSIIFLVGVTFPRMGDPKEQSLIFFGGIACYEEDECIELLSRGLTVGLLEDAARQVHINATIARKKYQYVKWAMRFLFCGMPFWLWSIFMLYASHSQTPFK